ncbi:hypothetical protein J2T13_002765 [Paenibacillus sp. DS2015]|uniref:hypothetical protein n=1 Tax=Paenibacillus sp. DS2015 TaxID=3373917 RepID=UPI003D1AE8BB
MNTLQLAVTNNGEKIGATSASHIELTVSSELMKNQSAAHSIDPQHVMKTVQDSLGDPMIFSIGNDNVFYVILRDSASKSGWQQYNLSTAIALDMEATSFEVAQGVDGRLLLALVMSPKGKRDISTLYLTPFITNDTTLTDWSKVGKQWVKRPFIANDASISGIWIGACDGQSALGVAAVAIEGSIEHYVFNTNVGDNTWLWRKFPLPENAIAIKDLAIGIVYGDPGVYALYETSAGQTLEFTSLPDPIYHKSANYHFPLSTNATSIATLPGNGNSDDLYVAGDGIFLFESSQSVQTTIIDKALVSGVHKLIVKQDAVSVSIFVVIGDEVLVHTEGLKSDIGKWSPPLAIRAGVTQISALRNPYKLTNELIIVKGNNKLSYLYQDPFSTLWKETTIDLPALDKIIEFNSYTTHISLCDANGKLMMQQPLQLTASSWTYVTINGESHSLDRDNPVTVSSDYSGNITIINRVTDISVPIYHIQCDLFAEVVDVNPATKVKEGLKLIQSGSDWKKINMQDGTPLLTEKFSDGTLSSAAEALKHLTQLIDTIPANSALQHSHLSHTATMRAAGSVSRSVVHASSLPVNYAWGMSFHEAGTTFWKPGEAPSIQGVPDWIDAIGLAIGDALDWIEEKIHEIGTFFMRVVNDVVEFCINLGTQVFKFIIDSVETSFRVISWVLKKTLGIDLDKLAKWVGFIFDWEDIKRVHRSLVHMANESLAFGESKINQIEGTVNTFFEQLKEAARKLAPIAEGDQTIHSQQRVYQEQQSANKVKMLNDVHMSPGGNWGQYHLQHSGAAEVAGKTAAVSDPIHSFVNDIIWPTLQSVETTAQQLVEDLQMLFDDNTLTLNHVIQKMASDVAVGFIDAIQKIVVGAIKFVEDLVKYIQSGINEKIEIPFFSAFYRQLAGNDLSILDAVMLVLAIPTTIAYKLIAGKAPFPAEQVVFENGSYEQIFGLLSGESHDKPTLRTTRTDLLSTSATAEVQADKDKVSDAVKIYSQLGGLSYLFAALASDTLGLVASMTDAEALNTPNFDEMERLENKAYNLEKWRIALSVAKIPGSYPVGTQEEVALQRAIWGISFASPFIELGLLLAMRKSKSKMNASRAKGVWNILEGVTVFVLECMVFDMELKKEDKSAEGQDEKPDSSIKFFQNCLYFISKEMGGVAAILPPNQVKWGLCIGSGASSYFAGLINLVRIITNISDNRLHKNF